MNRTRWIALLSVLVCFSSAPADDNAVLDRALTMSPFAPATAWQELGDLKKLRSSLDQDAIRTQSTQRLAQLLATSAFLSHCERDEVTAIDHINRSLSVSQPEPRTLIIATLILRSKKIHDQLLEVSANSEWHEDAVITRAMCMKSSEYAASARSIKKSTASPSKALQLLQTLEHPKPYVHIQKAYELHLIGQDGQALAELQQYLRAYAVGRLGEPELPHLLECDILFDLAEYQRAIESCYRGLRLDPKSVELRRMLVRALCKAGQSSTALELALQIASEEPGSFLADYVMQEALIASEEFRKSILYLERLSAGDHKAEYAIFNLVHVSMYCGEFNKVLSYVEEFNTKHPDAKIRPYLDFSATVSECYTADCSASRQQSLKETLKAGVESRSCCMVHVVLAIGAIHNMGETALARELAQGIEDRECDNPALQQLAILKKALHDGTKMQPVVWD